MAQLISAYDDASSGPSRSAYVLASDRVRWGAILAGATLTLVVQVMLLLLGLGCGLWTASAGSQGPSASALSIGALAGWALSGIAASAAGGFLAGRLCGRSSTATSGYHGLVSWAVSTLVVLVLTTSALGSVLGGAMGAVTGALGGIGHAVGGAAQAAAPSLPQAGALMPDIEQQIRASSGGQDPAQLRDAAIGAIRAALTGDAAQQQQAVDRAADALAKAENIPLEEAKNQVQRYRDQYQQALSAAEAKAAEAAKQAAKVTSEAALAAFAALLVGAVAAFVAGRLGTRRGSAVPTEA